MATITRSFEDEIRKDGEWLYSAEGYDVELNVHSPDLPWLVGEITYFHWKGIRGDDDDKGLRFGLRVNPATGLELGVEYEKQDDDNNSSDTRDWAGWVKYAGRFGESASAAGAHYARASLSRAIIFSRRCRGSILSGFAKHRGRRLTPCIRGLGNYAIGGACRLRFFRRRQASLWTIQRPGGSPFPPPDKLQR